MANGPASAMTQLLRVPCLLWLLLLCCLWGAAGCRPRDGRTEPQQHELMHTSFEELLGWLPALPPTLTTEKAHTGKYALRVDAHNAYSLTYRATLGSLCSHRPRRLTLGAWVWVPNRQQDVIIVVALNNPNDPDHPALTKQLYLNDSGPFGEWKYVSRDLDLPLGTHSNAQLVIYLWNKDASEPVYADDFRLTELW